MLVLVYIRTLIVPTVENGAALLALQRPFFPVTWSIIPGIPNTAATEKSVNDFFTYDTYRDGAYNLTNDTSGPLALAAVNCFKN